MNKRISYIDTAKGLAILLMIIGHCGTTTDVPYMNKIIYSFHMPLFVVISGMFIKEQEFANSIKKYTVSYLSPYLITTLIILFLMLAVNIYFWNLNVLKDYLLALWWKFIYFYDGHSGLQIGPIWFLAALFWGCVIYSCFRKLINDSIEMGVSCFGLFLISIKRAENDVFLPMYFNQGLCFLPYLFLGEMIRKHEVIMRMKSWNKMSIMVLLAIWIYCICCYSQLGLATCSFDGGLYSFIGSIFACLLVFRFLAGSHFKLNWMGSNTLYILCGHAIIWYFFRVFGNPFVLYKSSNYCLIIFAEYIFQIGGAIVLGILLKRTGVLTLFSHNRLTLRGH